MNTKFFISQVKISPRKVVESINCGETIESTKEIVARLWEGEVKAIRELTPAEVETVQAGWNVKF